RATRDSCGSRATHRPEAPPPDRARGGGNRVPSPPSSLARATFGSGSGANRTTRRRAVSRAIPPHPPSVVAPTRPRGNPPRGARFLVSRPPAPAGILLEGLTAPRAPRRDSRALVAGSLRSREVTSE